MTSEAGISESKIDVHWKEEPLVDPPNSFVAQANMADPDIYNRFSEKNFPECYREYADFLTWDEPWHTTLDASNPPFWKWFVGGKLNASYNCVDRHLEKYGNKAAIIWVPEPEGEEIQTISYQDLYRRVNEFSLVLKSLGLKTGDRVTFHLPMTPELPISMLACARLGIIHNEVFGGFSARACAERVVGSGSHVLVTCDGVRRYRRPKVATRSTHGTGCTLSAGIAAGLALGHDLERAVSDALDFVHRAIGAAPGLGSGQGPLNHRVEAPGQ